MSRSVVASIKVIFDVKEDVTPDAAKQQIERHEHRLYLPGAVGRARP
jgi:hypothetical protein